MRAVDEDIPAWVVHREGRMSGWLCKDRHSSFVGRLRRMVVKRGSREGVGSNAIGMPALSWSDGATSQIPQPFRVGTGSRRMGHFGGPSPGTDSFLKGLILAQNERWRRGLGMQVERAGRPVAEG